MGWISKGKGVCLIHQETRIRKLFREKDYVEGNSGFPSVNGKEGPSFERPEVGTKTAARQVYERLKTEAREGRLVPREKKRIFPTVREIVTERPSRFSGRQGANEKRYASWWIEKIGDKRINDLPP